MNILYLCDEYPPGRHGGIGSAVQLLARQMVREGHVVVVAGFYDWSYGGEDRFEDEGVQVYRFRRGLDSSWFSAKDTLRVRATYKLLNLLGVFHLDIVRSMRRYRVFLEKIIADYDIQLVERPDFNEYVQYCRMPVYFPELSVPVIVKLHGSISFIRRVNKESTDPLIFDMERVALLRSSAISSVSNYAAEVTADCFGIQRAIRVVYNGVRGHTPRQVPRDGRQVIYAGSLLEKKGIFQLMKAWNIVKLRIPDAKLLVAGKGPQERVASFLHQDVRQSVSFIGHVPQNELADLFAASAVAVFPSYAETFGLAVAEAMLSGAATISTTRGAGPEIVRDGIDGLLADPDDVEALAEKIVLLLSDNKLRMKFEVSGRLRIEENFEISRVVDRNLKLYQAVLSTGRL